MSSFSGLMERKTGGQIVREDAPAAAIPFGKVRRASRIHIFIRPQKPGKGAKPGKARKSPAKEVR